MCAAAVVYGNYKSAIDVYEGEYISRRMACLLSPSTLRIERRLDVFARDKTSATMKPHVLSPVHCRSGSYFCKADDLFLCSP